ncbi:MAG: tyrosine-type recombinase/integrase [Gammaproteobacteria bacterium]
MAVRKAPTPERDKLLADGRNMYLRLRPSGHRSWVLRRRRGRTIEVVTLGSYPDMSLAEARQKAGEIDSGLDRVNVTLKQTLDRYFEDIVRPRYRRWRQVYLYVEQFAREEPRLASMRLQDAQTAQLTAAMKRWAKRAPVGANRVLAILRQALGYAKELGWIRVSPLEGVGRRAAGGHHVERARERVLTDDELRTVWRVEHRHGDLLRFMLLTGARIGEAQKSTWAHVDLAASKWTIPAEHSKNKRAHWVPLPSQAREILGRQDRSRLLVFGIASDTAVQAWTRRWCKAKGIAPAFVPHDLRRTFATRTAGLGIAPHVVEKLLNHSLGGVAGVYNRATFEPERIAAAQLWADELERLVRS